MQATIGGTISSLSGGSFQNGAMTAAFAHLYNHCLHGQCATTDDDLFEEAEKIGADVLSKFKGHNNLCDAMRHADWQRRLTLKVGKIGAATAGYLYELQGLRKQLYEGESLRWNELKMDLHNNAIGRDATVNRIQIEPSDLVIINQGTSYE